MSKIKIKSLPKVKGRTRTRAGFAVFDEQKDRLKAEATRKKVSLSYLINMKLYSDWM